MKDKVLLVDDDAMVLAGLKRQLRNKFSMCNITTTTTRNENFR